MLTTGFLGGGVGSEAALAAALAQLKAGFAGAGAAAGVGAGVAAAVEGAAGAGVAACAGAAVSSLLTSAAVAGAAATSLLSLFFSADEELEADRSIEAAVAGVGAEEAAKAGKSFSPLGTL